MWHKDEEVKLELTQENPSFSGSFSCEWKRKSALREKLTWVDSSESTHAVNPNSTPCHDALCHGTCMLHLVVVVVNVTLSEEKSPSFLFALSNFASWWTLLGFSNWVVFTNILLAFYDAKKQRNNRGETFKSLPRLFPSPACRSAHITRQRRGKLLVHRNKAGSEAPVPFILVPLTHTPEAPYEDWHHFSL